MARYRLWMKWLGIICLLCVFSLSVSTPVTVHAQTDSCAEVLAPRLTIGGIGRVTPGNPNNLRDDASKTGDLVGTILAGDSFEVVDGPKCVEGLNWWQVNYGDNQGWTAEADGTDYWVEPYNPTFKVTTENGTTHVAYDNFSFDMDSSLAQNVDYDFEIARWNSQSPLPEHVCFNLKLDPPQDPPINQLCVLTTVGMDDYVRDLKQILTEKPSFNVPDGRTRIPIPYNGAAQLMQADLNYINTDSLQGVSFVTYYAQDHYIITGDALQYNFSGLTQDGRFIIFISYAVNTALLPANNYSNQELADQLEIVQENPDQYYKSIVDTLNKGNAADFTPKLDMLDAIAQSIKAS